jgi:hypothetical protein
MEKRKIFETSISQLTVPLQIRIYKKFGPLGTPKGKDLMYTAA